MLRSVSCQTRMLIYLFLKKALQETLKIFKKSNLKYLLTSENLNLLFGIPFIIDTPA